MGNLTIVGSEEVKILLKEDRDTFQNIDFSRAAITGKIRYKKFVNCSFSCCSFEDCDLSTCLFEKCSMYDSIFKFSVLPDNSIKDCDFIRVSMRNSLVRYVTFEDCNFNDIDINKCCDLGYARFVRCEFNAECFFTYSCLDATLFKFCCFDRTCKFENNLFVEPKFTFCDFPKNRIFINNTGHFNVEGAVEYHYPVIDMICPEEGSFIAYKKIKIDGYDKEAVVTLEIPAEAIRISGDGDKCRCDIAKVKKIEAINNKLTGELVEVPADVVGHSFYDCTFKYQKDKWVKANNFSDDKYKMCAPGIHFFMSKKKAIAY